MLQSPITLHHLAVIVDRQQPNFGINRFPRPWRDKGTVWPSTRCSFARFVPIGAEFNSNRNCQQLPELRATDCTDDKQPHIVLLPERTLKLHFMATSMSTTIWTLLMSAELSGTMRTLRNCSAIKSSEFPIARATLPTSRKMKLVRPCSGNGFAWLSSVISCGTSPQGLHGLSLTNATHPPKS